MNTYAEILNLTLDQIMCVDFVIEHNIVFVRTPLGDIIRYEVTKDVMEKLIECCPFTFAGFWHYPESIVFMDESLDASKMISARTFVNMEK